MKLGHIYSTGWIDQKKGKYGEWINYPLLVLNCCNHKQGDFFFHSAAHKEETLYNLFYWM